jgi:hypothetical protein
MRVGNLKVARTDCLPFNPSADNPASHSFSIVFLSLSSMSTSPMAAKPKPLLIDKLTNKI